MVFGKIREKLGLKKPDRIKTAWDRLHQEAAFIPIFNIDDLEARRLEIKTILDDVKLQQAIFNPELQKDVVKKVYALFFTTGDPWYRGLDNRELAEKVKCFLEFYNEAAGLDSFIPDQFAMSMQLLSLSFQELDVTNTPPIIIESRPIVNPQPARGFDLTQVDEIEKIRTKRKE